MNKKKDFVCGFPQPVLRVAVPPLPHHLPAQLDYAGVYIFPTFGFFFGGGGKDMSFRWLMQKNGLFRKNKGEI